MTEALGQLLEDVCRVPFDVVAPPRLAYVPSGGSLAFPRGARLSENRTMTGTMMRWRAVCLQTDRLPAPRDRHRPAHSPGHALHGPGVFGSQASLRPSAAALPLARLLWCLRGISSDRSSCIVTATIRSPLTTSSPASPLPLPAAPQCAQQRPLSRLTSPPSPDDPQGCWGVTLSL